MCQEETKICKVCGKEKPVNEFHKRKSVCKICEWLNKHDDVCLLNDLSLEENLIILDNILNEKIEYLNDFEMILHKPLNKILINIQKLDIRIYKLSVKTNCEVCGTKIIYKLSQYLNKSNYFCSNDCKNLFQSYSYKCRDGYQRCGGCKEEKLYEEFNKNGRDKYHTICKVCDFFDKRSINIKDNWSYNEYKIIIDNLLNKKVDCINDIIPLLNNKTLADIIDILKTKLKTAGVEIKVRFKCDQCGIDVYRPLEQYLGKVNHFCSKECYDEWQSEEVLMTCKWCGKEFYKTPLQGQENYFCSNSCCTKYLAQERMKPLVIANCEYCGAEFERKEYNTGKIYCSEECRAKGFNLKMSGENNPKYVERLKIECDWCGGEFEETENDYNQSVKHFCSRNCKDEYHAKVFSQTNEYKETKRIQMVNNLENGVFAHTNTRPQMIVNDLLKELSIENDNEFSCEYFAIDNYLKEFNLMIEVMGTFWHCDNRKYNKIDYIIQSNSIKRDKSKKTYINNQYDISILYLWEYDIENNLELCKQLILKYIKNKGKLRSYHSFNYEIKENRLVINNNIIIPYMDYDIKDLNEITDLSVKELKSRYEPEKHVMFNCEWCGKESSSFIEHYEETEHHFCSRKCNSLYYGQQKLKSKNVCELCGDNIPYKNGLCKVCIYKSTHDMKYSDKWTEEITNVVLNNVLYKRIEYLNELEDILKIPLKEILEYMKLIGVTTTLRVQRQCQQCGKEFTLPPNRIINGKDKYCSQECSSLSQRNKITLNCECCGQKIQRTQSQYSKSKHHFCSTECDNKWRENNKISSKITKKCLICGELFEVAPNRKDTAIVCSRECQGIWQSLNLVGKNANNYKDGSRIKHI